MKITKKTIKTIKEGDSNHPSTIIYDFIETKSRTLFLDVLALFSKGILNPSDLTLIGSQRMVPKKRSWMLYFSPPEMKPYNIDYYGFAFNYLLTAIEQSKDCGLEHLTLDNSLFSAGWPNYRGTAHHHIKYYVEYSKLLRIATLNRLTIKSGSFERINPSNFNRFLAYLSDPGCTLKTLELYAGLPPKQLKDLKYAIGENSSIENYEGIAREEIQKIINCPRQEISEFHLMC